MGLSSVIHGTLESKLRFLFESFDKDSNRTIDTDELIELLETVWRQNESCSEYLEEARPLCRLFLKLLSLPYSFKTFHLCYANLDRLPTGVRHPCMCLLGGIAFRIKH